MESFTRRICNKKRVEGGQGSPQVPEETCGPAMTPGSQMNRRVDVQDVSKTMNSRPIFAGAACWVALVVLFGLAGVVLRAESANSLFKQGKAAETREDYDAAFEDYQQALAKAPNSEEIRAVLYRVRITASAVHVTKGYKLLNAGKEEEALAEFLRAAQIDPGNESAQQAIAVVRQKHGEVAPAGETSVGRAEGAQEELDLMGAPAVLKPVSNEPVTLHMTEDAKVIYQAVGKAAGVNVLFDPDYTSKRIQVDLNNVSLVDALRIVGTISNTFWRPVTENTIFVATNTRAKRTELDEQAVETFYLANAWQQNDLTDVQTAIRNVLTNVKIYAVPSQNAIVMRGTPDELLLAQKLINDLDKARPEVVVDIAILEVSKNFERTLGIAWPTSVGVALQSPNSSSSSSTTTTTGTTTSTSVSPTLYDLSHLKASDFAVTIGGATANLLLTDSNTKILQNPRIRATDGQKQTMKIGSKIPVATGSYQSGAGISAVSGLVNTQFQYQDIGVNIEMTPTVHFDRDVTLKMKIEVTTHSGDQTISGVTEPIISQRVVDQVIRLHEGEASILGGIQNNQSQESWNGIPGLSAIPILKYLFGSKDHTISDDEIVFAVVPHIVRSQELDQANLRAIDTGAGQAIDLHHPDEAGSAVAPAPVVRPTAFERPGVGTVPGQSAQAAAPLLMAQMNSDAQNNVSPAAAAQPPSAPPALAVGTAFTLTQPAGSIASGASFQVPVVLNLAADVASVPIQLQYDPGKLTLVNVAAGNLLSKDGQAVALIHRDDGPGNITVVAARPPGAPGISGSGVVCVLTFQAKAAGETALTMTRAGAVNSAQQAIPAKAAQINLVIK